MKKSLNKQKYIPLFKVFMSKNVMLPLSKVLLSGYIGQGPVVDKFEKILGRFIKNPYIITVNNGTAALSLALRLANVKYGDEVITTPMTCTATNWPILQIGAKIVWADIDPNTGNVDPQSIKKNITNKTKAIMAVNWGGHPCDIDTIKKIAPGIPVIEDAAHAFGSIYRHRMVGQTADFTVFSFQAIKHLTTVDGGALAVKNKSDYDRGVLLRWYGIDRKTKSNKDSRIEIDVKEWGYKYHMNDVCAAIGLENYKYVKNILKKHRDNAAYYGQELKNIDGIELMEEHPDDLSSYWLFTIKVRNLPAFMDYMNGHQVMVSQVHRRNDTHPTAVEFKKKLPGVDKFVRSMVCIPVGWWVTAADRKRIKDLIIHFFTDHKVPVNKSKAPVITCEGC